MMAAQRKVQFTVTNPGGKSHIRTVLTDTGVKVDTYSPPAPSRPRKTSIGEKIKVLAVVPMMCLGGAETHMLSLIRAIDKKRFDMSVVAMRPTPANGLEDRFRALCPTRVLGDGRDSIAALREYIIATEPDVVVWYNYPIGQAFRGLKDRPLVVQIMHGAADGWTKNPYIESRDFVDHAVCCQETMTAWARSFCRCPVTAIRNGVDASQLQGEYPSRELGTAPFTVGYVGRMSYFKGLEALIAGVAAMGDPDVRLLMVGSGPLLPKLQDEARRLGVGRQVVFTGARSDIGSIMLGIDLLVLASEGEGLPMCVLEAMTCGTPVLASPVGGIPEIIEDGVTGYLLENRDPRVIAAHIAGIKDDAAGRQKVADAAQRFAEQHLTAARMARDYEALFRRLLTPRPSLLVKEKAGGIGDTLMAGPALAALRKANPGAEITVETSRPWLLKHSPDVDKAVAWGTAGEGFSKEVLIEHPEVWDTRQHITAHNLALVGADPVTTVPTLHLSKAQVAAGRALVAGLHNVVVIHPATPSACKLWPQERWCAVVNTFQAEGFETVQAGGAADALIPGCRSWLGADFMAVAAALRHCRFAVCIDSSIYHAATAMGLPAIGLFSGAGGVDIAGYDSNVNLAPTIPCKCNGTKDSKIKCKYGDDVRCMKSITEKLVLDAVFASGRAYIPPAQEVPTWSVVTSDAKDSGVPEVGRQMAAASGIPHVPLSEYDSSQWAVLEWLYEAAPKGVDLSRVILSAHQWMPDLAKFPAVIWHSRDLYERYRGECRAAWYVPLWHFGGGRGEVAPAKKPTRIMWHGHVAARKGLPLIVAAFQQVQKKVPDATLTILAGTGKWDKDAQKWLEGIDVDGVTVEQREYWEWPTLAKRMLEADLFIHADVNDGEQSASSTVELPFLRPIVVSPSTKHDEVRQWCHTAGVRSLGREMQRVLTDRGLYADLCAKAGEGAQRRAPEFAARQYAAVVAQTAFDTVRV